MIGHRGRWLRLSGGGGGGGGGGGRDGTEYTVCFPGNDSLNFSFLSSFLFCDWVGVLWP